MLCPYVSSRKKDLLTRNFMPIQGFEIEISKFFSIFFFFLPFLYLSFFK